MIHFNEQSRTGELQLLMHREERYEALKTKNLALISLLIYQGLTAGEIEKLNLKDLDLENGTIYIKESRKLTRRVLELHPKQFRIFENYINGARKNAINGKEEELLIGKLGTKIRVDDINYLISTFKPLFLDRNLNPKTIRQSVIANWLNEKHISLEEVQLMSGQRWISTTARYVLTPIAEQKELINKFHPLN